MTAPVRLLPTILAALAIGPLHAAGYFVYFGAYTGPTSKEIYRPQFDTTAGKLTEAEVAGEIAQPSWVTLHPTGRYLYAVSELGNEKYEGSGPDPRRQRGPHAHAVVLIPRR